MLTVLDIYVRLTCRSTRNTARPAAITISTMGASWGGGGGKHDTSSLEFEKNDIISGRSTKYPKSFPRTLGARHRYPIFLSKTSQKRKMFRAFGSPRMVAFVIRRDESVSTFLSICVLWYSGRNGSLERTVTVQTSGGSLGQCA